MAEVAEQVAAALEVPLPQRVVNVRKAIAGALLLNGATYKDALTRAGFSPWTARIPGQAGHSAESCLAELRKLDPDATPANILGLARTRALQALESTHGSKIRMVDITRLIDVTERNYGAGEPLDAFSEIRDNPARMEFARELARRVAERTTPQRLVDSQEGKKRLPKKGGDSTP